jgi:hypothetical protein
MRPRTLVTVCAALLVIAGGAAATEGYAATSRPVAAWGQPVSKTSSASAGTGTDASTTTAQRAAQPPPPAPGVLIPGDPSTITAPGTNFFGSANRESATSTTESMIKAWITSDYLRHQGANVPAATLGELHQMVVNSDDNLADKYYALNGGDPSITELIKICGLQGTHLPSLKDNWSYTMMSPADAVRMGQCIADGRAAGAQWTDWVLTTMRQVQGSVDDQQAHTGGGRWGIIDGLPAALVAQTAIKNGWTAQVYDHNWHINCLAIHPDFVLAIELHYPWTAPDNNWEHATNLAKGAQLCASVTRQLVGVPNR